MERTKDAIDVTIVVANAEAALRFYRDALGLKYVTQRPVPGGGALHYLSCGDSTVKLIEYEPDRDPHTLTGDVSDRGLRYWTISVADLDEVVRLCTGLGYEVSAGPFEVRPGVRIVMLLDPDGNRVELLEERSE